MRDGVVNAKQIERIELGDLSHACRQGEIVGRVFEEGVVRDSDFVEVDVGLAAGETEGLGVGDEVDLVAAGCQLDAKFGGDDTTAAVGWVTRDANLHRLPGLLRLRTCVCWTRFLLHKTLWHHVFVMNGLILWMELIGGRSP